MLNDSHASEPRFTGVLESEIKGVKAVDSDKLGFENGSRGLTYVIYSLPRCGSTSLAQALNRICPASCVIEPFNGNNYGGRYVNIVREQGLNAAMDILSEEATGIKHVWNKYGWPFAGGMGANDSILTWPKVKIVLLTRRNVLRRIISNEIAAQCRVYQPTTPSKIAVRMEYVFSPVDISKVKAIISDEAKVLDNRRARLVAAKQEWIEVHYESLYANSEPIRSRLDCFSEIARFLGYPKPLVFDDIIQQPTECTSEMLYRKIPNIGDVERECGAVETGFLFRS